MLLCPVDPANIIIANPCSENWSPFFLWALSPSSSHPFPRPHKNTLHMHCPVPASANAPSPAPASAIAQHLGLASVVIKWEGLWVVIQSQGLLLCTTHCGHRYCCCCCCCCWWWWWCCFCIDTRGITQGPDWTCNGKHTAWGCRYCYCCGPCVWAVAADGLALYFAFPSSR